MSSRRVLARLLRNPWLIQAVVAATLLGLAAWQINLGHVAQSFRDARYGWLLLALSIYVASRAVHALEWQITLSKVGRAPFAGLFGALLIGTLVNAVIPASAGDVVKIQVVANRYGLPRAGLVAGRGAEAVVNSMILMIFILVSFALPGVGFASPNLLWLLAAAAALAFVAAVAASRLLPDTLPRWPVLTRLPRRLYEGLEHQWPRLHDGFEVIRRPRLLLVALVLNLVGWAIDIVIYWSYGQAFNLQLPFAAYLSVTVVVALITVFPITFGNIGTYELAIVGVLALHGLASDEALAYAAGAHIFSTVFNISLGLLAMWSMGVQPRDVFRLRPSAPPGAAEEPRGPNGG
jgi:uncharacterized protein (TIRG00374 family)